MKAWIIDYREILAAMKRSDVATDDAISRAFSSAWLKTYKKNVSHNPDICEISLDGFEYIFDDAHSEESGSDKFVCERLIAVHGRSHRSGVIPREASRIRRFPRGAASDENVVGSTRYDRGHFIAHSSGGGMDINLFPQLAEVNRGWSKRGKVYRRMENYLVAHPGTYCFSRPIYSGWTDHPYCLEFGLFGVDKNLWVELFPNCSSVDEMQAIEFAYEERMRENLRS